MKKTSLLKKLGTGITLFMVLFFTNSTIAQLGYSSATMAMGKMNSNYGYIPLADKIIVEEFFNYHNHNISAPKTGESLLMDISWLQSFDKSYILQLGISTGTVTNLEIIPAVNVSLVIDRSGSMHGDRIAKAKEAAIEFVKRLREKDIVSVVIFDDKIEVVVPAQKAINKESIIRTIQSIEVRGSTDLNGGLIRGYQEVLINYELKYNNKVLMLTDAITNTGVVNPIKIVQNSNVYNKEYNIDITMIGIGVDFNSDLSRKISNNNKSSIFFINDNEDIKKVFIDEIESLLSPIAKNVKLEIEIDPSLEIETFFGYNPKIENNKISLDLENMNSGLTQVFIIKLKPKSGVSNFTASAELSYYDIGKKKNTQLIITEDISQKSSKGSIIDLKKNFDIAYMAQIIKEMCTLYNHKKIQEANVLVSNTIFNTQRLYPQMEDVDIKRMYDILTKYETFLIENLGNNSISSAYPY